MAVAPQFAGQVHGDLRAPIKADLFLDYVCPFSAKQYKTLYDEVLPMVEKQFPGKVVFIFRHQVQPWHPSSTLVHEAGIAVSKLAPGKFWDFSKELFDRSSEYYDESVKTESRNDTYNRLAKLAASAAGINEEDFLDQVIVSGTEAKNSGNKVTNDLKWQTKFARQNSIHVTPTVALNGVVDGSVSSSWTVQQWREWVEKNLPQ